SSAPHAEANFPQQNSQSSREAVQDHRSRQSFARPIVPASFAFRQERETQTAPGQNGAGGQNGRGASKSQSAVRLTRRGEPTGGSGALRAMPKIMRRLRRQDSHRGPSRTGVGLLDSARSTELRLWRRS